jgi:uncharacterized membrane protein
MNRSNPEINARVGIPANDGSLPGWLPYAILLGAAIILLLNWERIPERWVTHWGLRGEPDGWTNKSLLGVFMPIGFGMIMCAFLDVIAHNIASRKTAAEGFDLSPEAVSVMSAATANLVRLTSLALAFLVGVMAVALPLYQPRSPGLIVGTAFAVIAAAILIGLRRLIRVHRELKARGLLDGAKGWNGLTYNNPDDPRLWVPKPIGYGYTVNFGHRLAWPFFLMILAIPLMVVIVILVLVARGGQ